MAHQMDIARFQEELTDAFHWGDEERARTLVSQLAAQPRKARAVLEEMFESPDGPVRQAAAFGLGVLGGAASAKCLAIQLAIEEARGDHDGSSVVEVIVQSLGRIKDTSARTSLIRRLRKLASGNPEQSDLDDVAYALWRKRHPDLIPIIRSALEQVPSEASKRLAPLLCLLEKSPEELGAWVLDTSVPVVNKTNVLTILDEEVPDELLPVLPAFVSAAHALGQTAVSQVGPASYFCERLFLLLLLYRERLLPELPGTACSQLRDVARWLVAAPPDVRSIRAATLLQYLGRPEDVPLLEAHRPAEPILAKVFDDAAEALRQLPHPH